MTFFSKIIVFFHGTPSFQIRHTFQKLRTSTRNMQAHYICVQCTLLCIQATSVHKSDKLVILLANFLI